MNNLRIAILGISSVALRRFIPAILRSKNYKIEFVASRSKIKAKKLSKDLKCDYGNYEDLFKLSNKIDVVYISTPPNKRTNYFKKCIERGFHIFSEKPAFINLSNAKEIISMCNKKKILFFESWMFKYHPQHLKIKQLLKKKIIGKIKFFESKFFYPTPKKNNIRLNKNLNGGVLYDSIGYPINALNLFFDIKKFKSSYSLICDTNIKVDSFVNVQLQNKNIIANLSSGFGLNYESYYKFYGSKGNLELRRCFSIDGNISNSIFIYKKSENLKKILVSPADHFLIMIDKYAAIIKKNKFISYNNNLNLKYITLFEEIFNK